jgi:hypothetical protein
MKRFAFLLLIAGWLVPLAAAQETEHVQVGVNADYFRLSQTDSNMVGLGGRLGFELYRNIKFEAEMNYDFERAFTERFGDTTTGGVFTQRTGLHALHGEFGPKVNLGEHFHVHPFFVLKGGFMRFHLGAEPATFGSFFSDVNNLRESNTNAVFYPGGGLEGHVGPVGVRFDIGDEMYFNHGSHNNLRMSLGPYFRF